MSKEKKIFQLEKKEICITSSQIKQAIDLLVNENEILQEENKRLNNIINEIRNAFNDKTILNNMMLVRRIKEIIGSDKE